MQGEYRRAASSVAAYSGRRSLLYRPEWVDEKFSGRLILVLFMLLQASPATASKKVLLDRFLAVSEICHRLLVHRSSAIDLISHGCSVKTPCIRLIRVPTGPLRKSL